MPAIWSLLFRRPASPRRRSHRLHLERLEDRLVPAAHIGDATYATIQAAVDAANPGALITVDPGKYAEQVTVNKSVTLEGAQAGITGGAASRYQALNSESLVTGTTGAVFNITASNVTIDGFTIGRVGISFTEPPEGPLNIGPGIAIAGGVSGTHIQDNIIRDNGGGIALANGSGGQAVIQGNLIEDNGTGDSSSGPTLGTGIYSDQNISSGSLQNVLIQNNQFAFNGPAEIELNSTDSAHGASGIIIANNTFHPISGGEDIYLASTNSALISGNTIVLAVPPPPPYQPRPAPPPGTPTQPAIGLYGGDNDISILNNDVVEGSVGYFTTLAVLVRNSDRTPNTNIVLNDNRFSPLFTYGLYLDSNGYSGELNATGNYWGAATGPTTSANPGGTGVALFDPNHQVLFAPWLSSGANGGRTDQPGFRGDQASLISSNPTATTGGGGGSGANGGGNGNSGNGGSSSANLLPTLQQQLVQDVLRAQSLQGNLSAAQQQLSAWFFLASRQSLNDAVSLVFDEFALTAGSMLALQASMQGTPNAALLRNLEALESALGSNPLASTPAGQQLLALTGALAVTEIQSIH